MPSQAVLRSRCVNLESPAVRRLALKQNLRQNLSGRKFDILKPRWLPTADALLADKAYDADERVIEPLREAEIEPVIPAKANRKQPRPYDKDLYKDQNAARDKKLKKRSLFPLYVVEQLVQIERRFNADVLRVSLQELLRAAAPIVAEHAQELPLREELG